MDANPGEQDIILLVDDQPVTARMLERMLEGVPDLKLHWVQDPTLAVTEAERLLPAVLLLDLVMPHLDGLTLLDTFRAHPMLGRMPILLLSTEEDPAVKAQAFAKRASDYLIKLPAQVEMIARLRYHAGAYQNRMRRREAEEKYRNVVANSRDAIFLVETSSGQVVDCNETAIRLLKCQREKVLGMRLARLFGSDPDRFSQCEAKINAGERVDGETIVACPDGAKVPVDVTAVTFVQRGKRFAQWMFRDISERKQMLKSLQDLCSMAEAANRAKSAFLATMSHEIRTPLNAILGMGEALLETELTEEQRRYARIANRAGESLLGLINDILDLSRIEAGKLSLAPETFDLHQLAADTVEVFSEAARKKGIDLSLTFHPDVPERVSGDPTRLRQILFNLLGNAIKFTEKGTVHLSVTPDRLEQGFLAFSIRDTGIGIAEEQLESIFSPFTQADSTTTRRYGGTGLGLSICRRLVEMMDGRIWADSEPGVGSVFHFSIRLGEAARDVVLEEARATTGSTGPSAPLRILVVEDAEDGRVLIRVFLKDTPFSLVFAGNGQEGLAAFQQERFDLVLMDIEMPVMDGFDTTRRIRAFEKESGQPRTPVVALTAHALAEVTEKIFEAGCDAHLTKPIKKRDLLAGILRYASRG